MWQQTPCEAWIFFSIEGNELGKFFVENGQIKFEGNFDDMAKALFEQHLKPLVDTYIKESKKRGPYKKRKKNKQE